MHFVRNRPGRSPEPQHDVGADQAGEEHDFRREEQPDDRLAVGNRQPWMVLQWHVGAVGAIPMTVIAAVRGGVSRCVSHASLRLPRVRVGC